MRIVVIIACGYEHVKWFLRRAIAKGNEKAPHSRAGPLLSDRGNQTAVMSATYQIFTCLSVERTIGSVGLHWNAVAKTAMFDGAPIARN